MAFSYGRDHYRSSRDNYGRDSYGSRGYGGGGGGRDYNSYGGGSSYSDRGGRGGPSNKLYVGNLPGDIRAKEIEELFGKFGKIRDVELKTGTNGRGQDIGPPFAFVEFDDPRDAKDALEDLDGRPYDKCRLKVEYPRGGRGGFRGGFGGRGGGGGGGGRGRGPGRRSPEYCVKVSGLPPSGSWQDLKDHMREAGDVLYTDVYKDGTGYVEFARADHARYALKNLNDSKFRSHEGEVAYITISESDQPDGRGRGRSRSFSPPPYRRTRRSPSYSPVRKYSRSRSRSPLSP